MHGATINIQANSVFPSPTPSRIHLAYVPSYVFARLPCYCYVLQENVTCGVGWASVASQISFIILVKFGQNIPSV